MDPSVLAEIFAAFRSKGKNLDDLDVDDPIAKNGRLCEALFTAGVDALRRFPELAFSNLMAYVWDIYHYGHVKLAMGPRVNSLHIMVASQDGVIQALTLVPMSWPEMVRRGSGDAARGHPLYGISGI